jgi:hypothetical protein
MQILSDGENFVKVYGKKASRRSPKQLGNKGADNFLESFLGGFSEAIALL